MAGEMLTTLNEKVDPKHTALIVVDVMNDFCAEGGVFHKLGCDMSMIQSMVPRLVEFIEEARKGKLLTIYIQGLYDDVYLSAPTIERRIRAGSDVPLCISGTWGSQFYQIKPLPSETIVVKHRYSAFVDTDLDLVLRSRGIKTLIMTGVATNVCVESTLRDGFMNDYYILLPSDCTACYDKQLYEASLKNVELYFGVVLPCSEIVKAWHS